jgi:hypothetical protein
MKDEQAIVLDKPNQIEFARIAALAKACKLEAMGLRFRGGSRCQIARKEFGIKARSKKAVAEHMEKIVGKLLTQTQV